MSSDREGAWLGGYVRKDARGRPTYVIRRQVGERRYEVSTRCNTERAAVIELARFEADPALYRGGGQLANGLYLDEEILTKFLRDHAHNSGPYLASQRRVLAWWGGELDGVDLRQVSLRDHIHPALDKSENRGERIAHIKRLFSWLRERDLINAAQDPTLDKLKVPQARPAQLDRSKVIPRRDFERARKKLELRYRDVLDVLAGTGWHVTEAHRFAAGGAVEASRQAGTAAVLVMVHKNGAPHRTAVSKPVAQAARRLLVEGSFSISRFHRAVLQACEDAQVPAFRPGWFRHTTATIASDAGQEALVPGFLGHRSSTTTRRHYAVHTTPPKVKTLR